MPRWFGRLLWSMRGKRRVAVHLDRAIENGGSLTMEGVLIGRWSGVLVLMMGKLLEPNSDGSARTIPLDAQYIEIPKERELFTEVFAR